MKTLASFRVQLGLLLVIAISVSFGMAAESFWSHSRIINDAQRTFVAKDIVADILPPPLFIIEARLVLSQAESGSLTPPEAAADLRRLRGEYDARIDYWKRTPAHGLEQALTGDQHKYAMQFWTFVDKAVLPILDTGNLREMPRLVAKAHTMYVKHRQAVDETVIAGNKFAEAAMDDMAAAERVSFVASAGSLGIATVLLVSLFSLVGVCLWRQVGAEPKDLAGLAAAIADGDLTKEIPEAREGSLAASLEAMRFRLRWKPCSCNFAATWVAPSGSNRTGQAHPPKTRTA